MMGRSSHLCCTARALLNRLQAMLEVLHILFGAAFTVAVSTAVGTLLLRRLRLDLHRLEAALFAFVAGSGLLSLVIALLCVVHQARRGVFLWGEIGRASCRERV